MREIPRLRDKEAKTKPLCSHGESISLSETINASSHLDLVLYFYSLEQQQRYLSE